MDAENTAPVSRHGTRDTKSALTACSYKDLQTEPRADFIGISDAVIHRKGTN